MHAVHFREAQEVRYKVSLEPASAEPLGCQQRLGISTFLKESSVAPGSRVDVPMFNWKSEAYPAKI